VSPTVIILMSLGASVSALVTGVVVWLRIQAKNKRLNARFDEIVSAYGRTMLVGGPSMRQQQTGVLLTLWMWIASVIGYNPTQPFVYGVRWYIVVAVAFVPARLAVWLIVGLLGDIGILVLPVVWVFICRGLFGTLESRYKGKLLVQFPDALSMIVRAVRVGIPVNVAIQTTSEESPPETAREFQRAAEQLALGNSVNDAVAEMASRARITEYKFFATALALQSQTGGGLTETLENLADVIRKRVAMRARGNALAGEAKTSAGILAVLPVLTLGALLVLNPDYASLLFDDAGGRKLLAVACGMLIGGILVMRSMIKKSLT
jgi:tight adherence protein B